jgi:flagellar FliJ protein
MADLKALIRFRKHIVDEKQKALSQLYRDAEKIELTKQMLLDRMEKEKILADEIGPSAHIYLGHYLDGVRKKVRALDGSLKKMQVRIDQAQEDIRGAFSDMKKVEITQENREKEQAKLEKKKDDDILDDIGLTRFLRGE